MNVFSRNRRGDARPAAPAPAARPAAEEPPIAVPPRPVAPAAAQAAAAKTTQTPAREMPMPPAPPATAAPAGFRPDAARAAATAAPVAAPARPMAAAQVERRMLVVGRGISMQGTIADCERLVVEGTVEAALNNALEVLIAASGVFKGEIEIDDAEISGAFEGSLTCRNSLVVRATGRISGSVRCRRLSVEDGGQISGRIEMLPAETPRYAAASGAATAD